MNIRDLSLIYRNPVSNELDVKTTLQVFAEELFAWSDEEKKIKKNRRFRVAIRKVFGDQPKGTTIVTPALIAMALQKMRGVNPANYGTLERELAIHIRLNKEVYLRIVKGKDGGVSLLQKNP